MCVLGGQGAGGGGRELRQTAKTWWITGRSLRVIHQPLSHVQTDSLASLSLSLNNSLNVTCFPAYQNVYQK